MAGGSEGNALMVSLSIVRRQRIGWLTRVVVAWGVAAACGAATVRLDGDRLYVEARQERLTEVLSGFVHAGVDVRVEPGLDAVVNGVLRDTDIESGLDQLLGSFNYLLFWEVLEGPVGPFPRLSGMHVFRAGREGQVARFEPREAGSRIVRPNDGPAYLADEVLLGVKPGATRQQFRELLAAIGGTVIDSVPAFGVYRIRLPGGSDVPAAAAALARNPWIAVAEPNYAYEAPRPTPAPGGSGAAPDPRSVDAPAAGGAVMAVFDTGLTEIEGFGKDAVSGTFDAVEPGRAISDRLGHGTQMALIATGAVAPEGVPAEWVDDPVAVLAVRAFDDQGVTSNYSLLRGIEYAAEQGARVLSLSWGAATDSEFLRYAIGYAQDQDMVVVAAVGNEPTNQPVYPAAYRNVIGVSAMLPDQSVWARSNYGYFVTLSAPGSAVFPIGYQGPPGPYAGTSISTPYVARAVTQYFERYPDASAQQAIDALKGSLTDLGIPGRDDYYGYGALTPEAMKRFLGVPR